MKTENISIFVAVVNERSFTKAAKHLGLQKSLVSRKVAELETDFKTRFFERSTRVLNVTEEGQRFYEKAKALVAVLEELNSFGKSLQIGPNGTIAITCTAEIGKLIVKHVLPNYAQKCPQVQVKMHLGYDLNHLISDGFDLAIRLGKLADSSFISKTISNLDRKLYVSKEFLHKIKKENLFDEENISCLEKIPFSFLALGHSHPEIELQNSNNNFKFKPKISFMCNSLSVMFENIKNSNSAGFLNKALLSTEDFSTLVEIFSNWKLQPVPLQVLYPSREFMPAKVKNFLECLDKSELKNM